MSEIDTLIERLSDRQRREFALWCAERVRHLMTDPRSTAALDVAARHLRGEATDDELAAARAAARDAARERMRKARETNPQKFRERNAEQYRKHAEQRKADMRARYAAMTPEEKRIRNNRNRRLTGQTQEATHG